MKKKTSNIRMFYIKKNKIETKFTDLEVNYLKLFFKYKNSII